MLRACFDFSSRQIIGHSVCVNRRIKVKSLNEVNGPTWQLYTLFTNKHTSGLTDIRTDWILTLLQICLLSFRKYN